MPVPAPVPHPNCYWLPGGRILAGEYPREWSPDPAPSRRKLQAILDYGVRSFVDLTHPNDPLDSYEQFFAELDTEGDEVHYRRFSIPDMGCTEVPHMREVLDYIDSEIEAGRVVYVHCWGGIGRTGTVVGCWFRRAGLGGDAALARVAQHWNTMSEEKRRNHPEGSPQTKAQRAFVRDWPDEDPTKSAAARLFDKARRARGCLLGGALGDSLGATTEFMQWPDIRKKYGAHGIQELDEAYGRVGAITDDTQMTMWTAEGMLRASARWHRLGNASAVDEVYGAYLRWLATQDGLGPRATGLGPQSVRRSGRHPGRSEGSARTEARGPRPEAPLDGWMFQIPELHSLRAPGNTCLSALKSGQMGTVDKHINDSKGCGGVMRIAPVGIMQVDDPFTRAAEFAAITHGHPSGYYSAAALALMIRALMEGARLPVAVQIGVDELRKHKDAKETVDALTEAIDLHMREEPPTVAAVESLGGGWTGEEALAIGVYCALASGGDFVTGVRLSANHSGDTDSTASITGQLLGAFRGMDWLPADWLAKLELRDELMVLSDDLVSGFRPGRVWRERYPT